ncbi:MAG TPA: ABC transporter substrate-binding protein, partial [Microbacterium sp.]|nr:ABC transporter substrate-binding protein [Microbacterium sp.]
MLRRTTVAAAALLAAGALLLSACTGSTPPAPTSTGTPDTDASVAVRLVSEPSNLDIRETAGAALDQILIDNVYQGLVSRTPDQEIVDTLASSHDVSADGLTYTFTLREGVTFHDGQELTPQDVVWSLQQVKDNASYRDSARLERVTAIAASGQDIVLTLSEPDSSLLWNLSGRAGLVLKEGDTVDRKTAANGTGPFTLTSWKKGDSITLERNDAYWGDAPQVAEIVLDFIPDTQAALSGALAGELDVVTGFDANLTDQI